MPNKKLTSSKLNRKITIQEKATSQISGSRPAYTWTDVCSTFSARTPVSGREFSTVTAVNDELLVRYEIRYRPGITPDMRLVDRGRIYNIVAVMDDVYDDRKETHIVAREVSDG